MPVAVTARARKNDAVLEVTEGRWPTVDLHLDAHVVGYTGLDQRYGSITGVSLDVNGGRGVVTWTTAEHEAALAALKVAR